jgi:glutamine amidotransferase
MDNRYMSDRGRSEAPEMAPQIGLVDYGMGNRRSAEKALAHVGARVEVSAEHELLREMDGLVLPGVGAFPAGMRAIRERGLDELLIERAQAGVPLLGLCLGMQLLFERSEEHGGAEGLGLLAGTVRRLPADSQSAPGLKLPHIGWSEVHWRRMTPLSEGLPDPSYLYHVHSFAPVPADEEVVLATADYGEPFAAIVGAGNVYGTQSHPEKSSAHGLALLANFTRLCGRAAVPA